MSIKSITLEKKATKEREVSIQRSEVIFNTKTNRTLLYKC